MLEVQIVQGPTRSSPGEIAVIFTPTRRVDDVMISIEHAKDASMSFRPDEGGYWIDHVDAGQTVTRLFTVLARGESLDMACQAVAVAEFEAEQGKPRTEERDPFEVALEGSEFFYVVLGAFDHARRTATGVYDSFRHQGREMYRRDVQPTLRDAEGPLATGFGWAVDAVERGVRLVTRPTRSTSRRK